MAKKPKETEPKPEEIIDAEFEPVDEPKPLKDVTPPRKRPAWPLVWILFGIAIFAGGALGMAGSFGLAKTIKPQVATSDDQASLQAQLAKMEEAFKTELTTGRQAQSARLVDLQSQLDKLQAQPISETASEAALAAFHSRIEALEARPLPVVSEDGVSTNLALTPLLDRLSAVEANSLDPADLTGLVKITDLPDNAAAFQVFNQRLAALENRTSSEFDPQIIQEFADRLSALEADNSSGTIKAGRAMALADLKLAAQGSSPFAVAFAKARLQYGPSVPLDNLAVIAGTSTPTRNQLAEDLKSIIPLILREARKPADDASLIDKAGAAMRSLVSVRRTDGKGEGLQADLARAETALELGDLKTAIDLVEKAKGDAVKKWLLGAKNRQTIEYNLAALEREQASGEMP